MTTIFKSDNYELFVQKHPSKNMFAAFESFNGSTPARIHCHFKPGEKEYWEEDFKGHCSTRKFELEAGKALVDFLEKAFN